MKLSDIILGETLSRREEVKKAKEILTKNNVRVFTSYTDARKEGRRVKIVLLYPEDRSVGYAKKKEDLVNPGAGKAVTPLKDLFEKEGLFGWEFHGINVTKHFAS